MLDTWVLYKVAELDLDAVRLGLSMGQDHRLCLDHEGHIQKEYERCFRRCEREGRTYPGNEILTKWWEDLARFPGTLVRYHGKIAGRHRAHLLNRLNFDSSDLPFVAIAARSPDKLLVTEDSDYTPDVQAYLRSQMGIQVLGLKESVTRRFAPTYNSPRYRRRREGRR